MTKIEELVFKYGGSPLATKISSETNDLIAMNHAKALRDFLRQKNGFYAFESALHVFPLSENDGMDILRWNSASLWKETFKTRRLMEVLFFAENIFGEQFCLRGEGVGRFDPETGEIESIADSLEGWAKALLDEPDFFVGHSLAHEWQGKNGSLKPGCRLVPKKPFILGGDLTISNLAEIDAVKGMRFRGELATKLLELPDGSTIRLEMNGEKL